MQSLRRGVTTPSPTQIQCGGCEENLPIRLTHGDEQAAVWICAKCNNSYVGCCVKESLVKAPQRIRIDERYFDITGQPEISLGDRKQAVRLASRQVSRASIDRRRSERVSKSLVAPAIRLCEDLTPYGEPFSIMIANLSSEGVGLVHDEKIEAEYLAIELSPQSHSPIQVIVHLVRQREIMPPYHELGGELLVRLGSLAAKRPPR